MLSDKRKICVVLVDIRSAHNVGSILRTADGFNAEVILVGITPRPMLEIGETRLPYVAQKAQKLISKTALGAETTVKWQYFSTFSEACKILKKEKYQIVAIEQTKDSKDIRLMSKDLPVALVVGTEVEGLPTDVLDICNEIYEIPMSGSKESFNVSIAAAISMYQARLR